MGAAAGHRIRTISSRQNSWVKTLRRAFAEGGPLERDGCAIDSLHIVQEAARSRIRFRALFFTAAQALPAEEILAGFDREAEQDQPEALLLSEEVFNSAVPTQSPQGIAALIEPPVWQLPQLLGTSSPFFLCSAGLQDPGNIGTILRSAEAFGASALLCLPGTVNVWNAKAVRASAGSVFRLPSVSIDLESLSWLRQHGIRLIGTAASNGSEKHGLAKSGTAPWDIDFKQPCAVLIGNEGAGIPGGLLSLVDRTITVPQKPQVESINAAMAATIICYEASRQRGL